ncbi:AAT1 [Auxenochlorella protothecoides x Auxenochlorella symbiontica]
MIRGRRIATRLLTEIRSLAPATHDPTTLPAQLPGMSRSAHDSPRPASKEGKAMHPDLLNDNILKTQYAVRGELYTRAQELAKSGGEVIYTNIGNPQQLGQEPLVFNRQVLALLLAPFLLDHPSASALFPREAIDRARELLAAFGGRMGAYSDARGAPAIRQQVAAFIEARDGQPANPEDIYLTDGASVGVKYALNALIRDGNDGILCPIPQYPLYSAAIQLFGGKLVPYYLEEDAGWDLNLEALRGAVKKARAEGTVLRALAFINPGNPTGQVLTRETLRELIAFAHDEGLVLLADEVYQPNIYQDEKPFVSAKRVLREMGEPWASSVELASFHTVSKGMLGECGLRGGYVEWVNIHPGAQAELYKVASVNLCPNTVGQATVSLMVAPPTGDSEAARQYAKQYEDSLASLRRRAHIMTDAFNGLEGASCNFTEGAMYSFPRLHLPAKAIQAAKEAGKDPDTFYCLALLADTGIVTVPGSGFGQVEGTFHLRTTILPQEDVMHEFVDKLRTFHKSFMAKYKD